MNIWGIEEPEGDRKNCPVIPANLPLHKRVLLTFFRFGICPVCITMSLGYAIMRLFRRE